MQGAQTENQSIDLEGWLNLGQVESFRREHGYNEIPGRRENPAILFIGGF